MLCSLGSADLGMPGLASLLASMTSLSQASASASPAPTPLPFKWLDRLVFEAGASRVMGAARGEDIVAMLQALCGQRQWQRPDK